MKWSQNVWLAGGVLILGPGGCAGSIWAAIDALSSRNPSTPAASQWTAASPSAAAVAGSRKFRLGNTDA